MPSNKAGTLNNDSVQAMIAKKLADGVTDEAGNKLSKIGIQAEIARAFAKQNVKPEDIDFLVYGKES